MIIITINVGYILLTSLNASQIKVSFAVVNDFNQLKRSMCPAPAPPRPVDIWPCPAVPCPPVKKTFPVRPCYVRILLYCYSLDCFDSKSTCGAKSNQIPLQLVLETTE